MKHVATFFFSPVEKMTNLWRVHEKKRREGRAGDLQVLRTVESLEDFFLDNVRSLWFDPLLIRGKNRLLRFVLQLFASVEWEDVIWT